MPRLLKTEIPWPSDDDLSGLFSPLAEQPWSAWLDSGTEPQMAGRYDIMVAEPVTTLLTREGNTTITHHGQLRSSTEDPLALLRSCLGEPDSTELEGLPFAGGAVGYFGYDLGRLYESLPVIAEDDLASAQLAVGIYEWALVCDREVKRCWLVSCCRSDAGSPDWQRLVRLFSQPRCEGTVTTPMQAQGPAQSNMNREAYSRAFATIQHYLEEGDCYQVNLAQRFAIETSGSPWQGYLALRRSSAGPFSAYLNTPDARVLCTSPERFLKLRGGEVETRPIKGTRRRDSESEKDRALRDELAASEKDRAENLMIVDLLRNDLGKSCRTGTVRVPELFRVESFATVHHLVSTVTGTLDEGVDALSLLRDCFPGGSITGAPKLRAMTIIEQLEPHRRGVYCGAIGYIGFDGAMDTNIVIRTAIHRRGRLYYYAGGGIVRDSSCEEEYQESFDKARAFLDCFSFNVDG